MNYISLDNELKFLIDLTTMFNKIRNLKEYDRCKSLTRPQPQLYTRWCVSFVWVLYPHSIPSMYVQYCTCLSLLPPSPARGFGVWRVSHAILGNLETSDDLKKDMSFITSFWSQIEIQWFIWSLIWLFGYCPTNFEVEWKSKPPVIDAGIKLASFIQELSWPLCFTFVLIIQQTVVGVGGCVTCSFGFSDIQCWFQGHTDTSNLPHHIGTASPHVICV